jgi:hypothetical protein
MRLTKNPKIIIGFIIIVVLILTLVSVKFSIVEEEKKILLQPISNEILSIDENDDYRFNCPRGDVYYMDTLKSNGAFGFDVEFAGDVNNDGYDDILITKLENIPYGTTTRPDVKFIVLSGVDKSVLYEFSSRHLYTAPENILKLNAEAIGDLNGDEFDDLAINDQGISIDFFSGQDGTIMSSLQPPQGSFFTKRPFENIGDVNFDSIDDFAVEVSNNANSILVYSGASNSVLYSVPINGLAYWGNPQKLGDLNGDSLSEIGVVGQDYNGYATGLVLNGFDGSGIFYYPNNNGINQYFKVVGLGLIDNDFIPDIGVVKSAGANNVKYVQIFSGYDNNPILNGFFEGDNVAGIGDVNGDTYDDFVVSSSEGNGFVKIISGRYFQTLYYLEGKEGQRLGFSVDGNGDINGDGSSEILISAPGWDSDNYYSHFLQSSFPAIPESLNGEIKILTTTDIGNQNTYPPRGDALVDNFCGISTEITDSNYLLIPDVNNDGIEDIIFGDYRDLNNRGRVLILSGMNFEIIQEIKSSTFSLQQQFGHSVAVGNFDTDLELEIAISAPKYALGNSENVGAVYIYELTGILKGGLFGNGPGERFGNSIAVGERNGDGIDDIVIGSPGHPLGSYSYVKVYNGDTLQLIEAFYPYGNSVFDIGHLGYFVGVIPDMNNDNKDEIVLAFNNVHYYSLTSNIYKIIVPGFYTIYNTQSITTDSSIESGQIVDFNGDGYPDIKVLVLEGNIEKTVIYNGQNGNKISSRLGDLSLVSDIDNDGQVDFFVGDNYESYKVLSGNTGRIILEDDVFAYSYNPVYAYPLTGSTGPDVNNDGKKDIILSYTNNIFGLTNLGKFLATGRIKYGKNIPESQETFSLDWEPGNQVYSQGKIVIDNANPGAGQINLFASSGHDFTTYKFLTPTTPVSSTIYIDIARLFLGSPANLGAPNSAGYNEFNLNIEQVVGNNIGQMIYGQAQQGSGPYAENSDGVAIKTYRQPASVFTGGQIKPFLFIEQEWGCNLFPSSVCSFTPPLPNHRLILYDRQGNPIGNPVVENSAGSFVLTQDLIRPLPNPNEILNSQGGIQCLQLYYVGSYGEGGGFVQFYHLDSNGNTKGVYNFGRGTDSIDDSQVICIDDPGETIVLKTGETQWSHAGLYIREP